MRKITITDVAEKANVSKSTVSQYLNKRFNHMAEETKLRIERTIEELGYHPNYIARSLKQKRTSTVGVIVANILHSFSTQVIRAIEDVCHENDIHLIVCNADDNPEKENNYIHMLRAKQVDGLFIFPTGGNVELYQSMVKENYPIVFIDRMVTEINNVDTVLLENENASYTATEMLIKNGHRNIAIITQAINRNISPRLERIQGYKKALQNYDIPMVDEYIKALDINQIETGLENMFSISNPPTAIIAGNDLSLMEILNFIKKKNYKIPQDIAVISIDDVPFANVFDPPLTTIKQPTFEIGRKAAELLINKIENPNEKIESKIYRFKPELMIRKSC